MFRVAAGFAVSLFIIYTLGTVWLMEYLHLSLEEALLLGTIPFIGFDIMKAIVAAPIVVRMRVTRFDLPVNRISETTNSIPEQSPTEKEL